MSDQSINILGTNINPVNFHCTVLDFNEWHCLMLKAISLPKDFDLKFDTFVIFFILLYFALIIERIIQNSLGLAQSNKTENQ